MSNKEFVYLIYEKELKNQFLNPKSFARTQFEATKEIVTLAKKKINYNENNNIPILWLGKQPTQDGLTLVYSLHLPNPINLNEKIFNPNVSLISIYDVKSYTGWFSKEPTYFLGEPLYQVFYETLPRCNAINNPNVICPQKNADVKYEPNPVKKNRGNSTPHDQLLNAIETRKKNNNIPFPPPLPNFTN